MASIKVYYSAVDVTVPQLVRCAYCECGYVYEMKVVGFANLTESWRGEAEDRARTAAAAREHLNKQLNDPELCSPVPCPECYRYQRYMFKKRAEPLFAWLKGWVPNCCYVVSAIACFIAVLGLGVRRDVAPSVAREDAAVGTAAALVGVLTLVGARLARRFANARIAAYNPNKAEPKGDRRRIAEQEALTPEEFDEKQTKRVRKEYTQYEAGRPEPPDGEENDRPRPKGEGEAPDPDGLVVSWWVAPTVFVNGGRFSIRLSGGRSVTVSVPADAEQGTELDARRDTPGLHPFRVRVMALRVHLDECRVD